MSSARPENQAVEQVPAIPASLPEAPPENSAPDLEAIAVFAALGFFLGTDTYFKGHSTRLPGHLYKGNVPVGSWFEWHYSPRDISFDQAVDEFADLFESITRERLGDRKVILPLSGGLDSRTQAAALKGRQDVFGYSYAFEDGINETKYGQAIAKAMGWPFRAYTIQRGYLWDRIDQLAAINGCYSEFTHPRQMALYDEYPAMGDVFYLGHWGDVLFDDMSIREPLTEDTLLAFARKKVLKKGGVELGRALWETWGLPGSFDVYLDQRLDALLSRIRISEFEPRIRAFKSLNWAPRWTSVNLSIFAQHHPVELPYFDHRICEFICSVPEAYLAGRRIQIEYLKRKAPELAKIPWQPVDPLNLYNHEAFRSARNLPARILKKGRKVLRNNVLKRPIIQRNWELQFLGERNDQLLRERLFESPKYADWIPAELPQSFYTAFQNEDAVRYSHPVSMLLTLSLFAQNQL